jgi:hypothetical protein
MSAMGRRVGGGVEGRGAAPARCTDKVERGGGGMESRKWQVVEKSRSCNGHKREVKGWGRGRV